MTELLLAFSAPDGGNSLLDDLGINFMVLGTQVVIFVFTFVVLSRLLFGRVLGHMTRREGELRSSRDSIAGDREEAARLAKEFEEHMAKADKAAYDRMQDIYRGGMAEAGSILAEAEGRAREELAKANAEIAAEKSASIVALRSEVATLTLEATSRILEMKPDPAHRKIVEKFVAGRS